MTNNALADVFAGQDVARTCVVNGHGAHIGVEKGHLLVKDGIGPHRRVRRYNRATAGIDRIVMLAPTGTVTNAAHRWISAIGATYLHLGPDGTPLVSSTALGTDNPGLRRAQALAAGTPTGTAICHTLLAAKLAGQRHNLTHHLNAHDHALGDFDHATAALDTADTAREFLFAEARAAAIYWHHWANVTLDFASRDHDRIAEHWWSFGTRSSHRTRTPRAATNPANALLNYLYRLLEAQGRFACLTVGLDPGVGVLHADQPARDSLVLDITEPVRPWIDQHLLALVERRAFAAADFTEQPDGTCRINPPLTHTLAETLPEIAKQLGPHVENTAKTLQKTAATRTRRPPTPLTGTNRAARHHTHPEPTRKKPAKKPERTCRACGTGLGYSTERIYCDRCTHIENARHTRAWSNAGVEAQAQALATGNDPRQTPAARAKRSAANTKRHQQRNTWTPDEPIDPTQWADHILPGIQHLTLSQLANATGLSKAWCSKIKRGHNVPHPMHWQNFADLIDRPD